MWLNGRETLALGGLDPSPSWQVTTLVVLRILFGLKMLGH